MEGVQIKTNKFVIERFRNSIELTLNNYFGR